MSPVGCGAKPHRRRPGLSVVGVALGVSWVSAGGRGGGTPPVGGLGAKPPAPERLRPRRVGRACVAARSVG